MPLDTLRKTGIGSVHLCTVDAAIQCHGIRFCYLGSRQVVSGQQPFALYKQ